MQLRFITLVSKGIVLVSALLTIAACSKNSSQVVGPSTRVDEFTAFHPVTGLPLKPEDLTQEMLREDADYGAETISQKDQMSTMDVYETEVDIEKMKDVMVLGYTPDGAYNSHITPQCYRTEVERMVASAEVLHRILRKVCSLGQIAAKENYLDSIQIILLRF